MSNRRGGQRGSLSLYGPGVQWHLTRVASIARMQRYFPEERC